MTIPPPFRHSKSRKRLGAVSKALRGPLAGCIRQILGATVVGAVMAWLGVDVVLLTRWFSARAGLFEHDLNAALRKGPALVRGSAAYAAPNPILLELLNSPVGAQSTRPQVAGQCQMSFH
jgi:hypothetical protein